MRWASSILRRAGERRKYAARRRCCWSDGDERDELFTHPALHSSATSRRRLLPRLAGSHGAAADVLRLPAQNVHAARFHHQARHLAEALAEPQANCWWRARTRLVAVRGRALAPIVLLIFLFNMLCHACRRANKFASPWRRSLLLLRLNRPARSRCSATIRRSPRRADDAARHHGSRRRRGRLRRELVAERCGRSGIGLIWYVNNNPAKKMEAHGGESRRSRGRPDGWRLRSAPADHPQIGDREPGSGGRLVALLEPTSSRAATALRGALRPPHTAASRGRAGRRRRAGALERAGLVAPRARAVLLGGRRRHVPPPADAAQAGEPGRRSPPSRPRATTTSSTTGCGRRATRCEPAATRRRAASGGWRRSRGGARTSSRGCTRCGGSTRAAPSAAAAPPPSGSRATRSAKRALQRERRHRRRGGRRRRHRRCLERRRPRARGAGGGAPGRSCRRVGAAVRVAHQGGRHVCEGDAELLGLPHGVQRVGAKIGRGGRAAIRGELARRPCLVDRVEIGDAVEFERRDHG